MISLYLGGLNSAMFSIVPIIIIIGFVLIFGMIIANMVKSANRYKRNNDSPILTVDATVATKRADVRHNHHNGSVGDMHHTTSYTTYYVTFEVASGDRMELEVLDTEYGLLVETDIGKLTFQGTRYLGFERSST